MKKKLSFAELEKEMNLIPSKDLETYVGGTDFPSTTILTPEQIWAIQHPFDAIIANNNSSIASSLAAQMSGVHNGVGDAFRHSFWMALNGMSIGKNNAISLGVAHEQSGASVVSETSMDLNNNSWGAQYGSQHQNGIDFGQFLKDFQKAVDNGTIKIIDTSGGTKISTNPNNYDWSNVSGGYQPSYSPYPNTTAEYSTTMEEYTTTYFE